MASASSNSELYIRLYALVFQGGTLVLRNIFDQKLHNVPLNVFLAAEKTSINRLFQGQKTVTRAQYALLYPQSGQLPMSSDFDITLIIYLLKNLKSLGLNPNYNWNATPHPADTSVEADLVRLNRFRNEVVHVDSPEIQPVLFQTKWKEIKETQKELQQNHMYSSVTQCQTKIQYYKSWTDYGLKVMLYGFTQRTALDPSCRI